MSSTSLHEQIVVRHFDASFCISELFTCSVVDAFVNRAVAMDDVSRFLEPGEFANARSHLDEESTVPAHLSHDTWNSIRSNDAHHTSTHSSCVDVQVPVVGILRRMVALEQKHVELHDELVMVTRDLAAMHAELRLLNKNLSRALKAIHFSGAASSIIATPDRLPATHRCVPVAQSSGVGLALAEWEV